LFFNKKNEILIQLKFKDAPQSKYISEKRINLNDFLILKTIGRGAFGKVQLVNLNF